MPFDLGSGITLQIEQPGIPTINVAAPSSPSVAVLPVAGPPGTSGTSGVEPFEFVQATPAAVWGPIAHGFGRRPVAWSLYDTDDRECGEYEVQHLDLDTCRVSMDVPTAGVIRLL